MKKFVYLFILLLVSNILYAENGSKPIKSFYGKEVYLYSEDGKTELKVAVTTLGNPKDIVVYGVDKDNYLVIKYKQQYFSLSKTDVSLENWFEKSSAIAHCKKTNTAIDSTSGVSMGLCEH